MLLVSKILDGLSLIAIVFLMVMYLFCHWTFVPLALTLIAILLVRLVAQTIKARYYEKEYEKIKNKTRDILKDIEI